jgi:hypothetical protein
VLAGQPAPGVDAVLAGGGDLARERLAAELDQLLVGQRVAELTAASRTWSRSASSETNATSRRAAATASPPC